MANEKKGSGCFIGRTDAYYNDDDESVFTPDYWTRGWSRDDSDFAVEGPVYELTEEGDKLLSEWCDDRSAGYDLCYGRAKGLAARYSKTEMWELLTNPENGYIIVND